MKSKIALVILFISGMLTSAQAQVNHQLGLNCSQFVKQFITPNNTAFAGNNPYLLTYRMLRPKINYRAGFGGNYSFTNEDNQTSQFLQNTDIWNMSTRIGFDFNRSITKRLNFYYGLDFTYSQNSSIIKTTSKGGGFISNTTVTRKGRSTGAAGAFTFEYMIDEKISMFTELNLNFSRGRSSERVDNPDFPNSSTENKTRTGNFVVNAPISIFLSIYL
jgi:hypothetical protein